MAKADVSFQSWAEVTVMVTFCYPPCYHCASIDASLSRFFLDTVAIIRGTRDLNAGFSRSGRERSIAHYRTPLINHECKSM
jgi:hypothetical protein